MATLTKATGAPNGEFENCPEGDLQGVVVDICDLGWKEKFFEGKSQGLKPHVQFIYQVGGNDDDGNAVIREDGKPYLVFGRRLVLSTHERASFYKEICSIMGKKKIDELLESGTLDTEDFVGCNVNMIVVHTKSQDGTRTFANIESMKPWHPKYGDEIYPRSYTRRHERDGYEPPETSAFEPLGSTPAIEVDNGPKPIAQFADENFRRKPAAPAPKPTPRPAPDPRASNSGPTQREVARQILAQNESEDEGDIFDDYDNAPSLQQALIDAPAPQYPAN